MEMDEDLKDKNIKNKRKDSEFKVIWLIEIWFKKSVEKTDFMDSEKDLQNILKRSFSVKSAHFL